MAGSLIEEATKKAAVAWVAVAGGPARALWCMPADGSLWIVTGSGEQRAPELVETAEAAVTLRGSHGGRIVTWPARVRRLHPEAERWAEIVPQLAGKRLNAPGDPTALAQRWAAECAVVELVPSGEPVAAGDTLPDSSLAEPPRETPARRATRAPFRLHRVRRPSGRS